MRTEILNNLGDPRQLEKLYRENKSSFKNEFNIIFPDIREKETARIWFERLNFESEEISWGTKKDLIFVIAASCIAGLIAKIPDLTSIKPEFFYPRNLSFIVFPFLTVYFAWKQNIGTKKLLAVATVFLISVIYINLLPGDFKNDTLILACIHLPIILWVVLSYAFAGGEINNYQRRLDFLRFNGDLIVMTTIILLAGILLAVVTRGLFHLIDMRIEDFYFNYIGILGLASSPIIGTYLVRTNPQLVNKISPVIAKVFTPLVFLTLLIYLVAIIYTGKDPYNDREFLLIFNLLLIGVMAIILFSIAETSKNSYSSIQTILLFGLSIVTIIVNGIALSAILFRISELGITPNRVAVLGGNVLILTNLLIVAYRLFKTLRHRNKIESVEKSITSFLPVYIAWATFVTFILPILFSFK